jgi:hypothetical protein
LNEDVKNRAEGWLTAAEEKKGQLVERLVGLAEAAGRRA